MMLAPMAQDEDELEAFLTEQLEAIADELFERVYGLQQKLWLRADCPWCKRLRVLGRPELPCPICDQILRSQELDDEPVHLGEQAHPRTRKNTARVRVFVDYQVAPTPRIKGKRHGTGATRAEWQCRLTMDLPIPTNMADVAAFGDELSDRFRDEVHAQPFITMR